MGFEQGRKDDLESVAYLLAYLIRGGNLPWIGVEARTLLDKYRKIMILKEKTTGEELFKGYPKEFSVFF